MGEVIPFPSKPERTGYTGFSELHTSLRNHFEQANDTNVNYTDRDVISQKRQELQLVAEKILARIDELEGIQVKLPEPTEFASFAKEILMLVFTNQGRVAEEYYEIPTTLDNINTAYKAKYRELQLNQLDAIS